MNFPKILSALISSLALIAPAMAQSGDCPVAKQVYKFTPTGKHFSLDMAPAKGAGLFIKIDGVDGESIARYKSGAIRTKGGTFIKIDGVDGETNLNVTPELYRARISCQK